MPVTVPTAAEYARLPYRDQVRLTKALKALLAAWAETERPRE